MKEVLIISDRDDIALALVDFVRQNYICAEHQIHLLFLDLEEYKVGHVLYPMHRTTVKKKTTKGSPIESARAQSMPSRRSEIKRRADIFGYISDEKITTVVLPLMVSDKTRYSLFEGLAKDIRRQSDVLVQGIFI